MNIEKIKQVIELLSEIKNENKEVINIYDKSVLIQSRAFEKLFADKEYSVEFYGGTYYYKGIYEGLEFRSNDETPIFQFYK